MRQFKLGLIINPYAGIGGALALKGSDGPEIREKALSMGAEKRANGKTQLALEELLGHKDNLTIYTASGEMGEDLCRSMGFRTQVIYTPENFQTEPEDSQRTAQALLESKVDLILFAGGDGTARNIYDIVADKVAVLGVPAGCKIHSGVYAITPKSAGRVVNMLIQGEIVSLSEAEVKDIDEEKFRQGKVNARYYGEMRVPTELRYIQAVKMGGKESEELVLIDIAAQIIELMQDCPETVFIMGSGSTVGAIMQELGLPNTLLGVDIVVDQHLVLQDATEKDILRFIENKPCKLVITLIGGQGHIFGRGNQQLSPQVVSTIGRDNINIVATKSKLQSLQGRPLISDIGDVQVDAHLSGLIPVITGYRDQVLYPIAEI
ncbi:ATP-NAD kinase family protein [Aliiglaciecola sp. 3_MG-2023]|uniref:ATP-NAD kinase family protein n=1 Tax=Aliiglaciecola sp. 3_MG-2023 TaxID=3062644 RepID=UPI0026E22616|nr:ATP-NAD kinase family protein [Aliiglaciecola sp. 3_MG-2023]MDO6695333.1 ATP-NAD kinase family protein [Aliiglaciecola sp. 3_MG-2023]